MRASHRCAWWCRVTPLYWLWPLRWLGCTSSSRIAVMHTTAGGIPHKQAQHAGRSCWRSGAALPYAQYSQRTWQSPRSRGAGCPPPPRQCARPSKPDRRHSPPEETKGRQGGWGARKGRQSAAAAKPLLRLLRLMACTAVICTCARQQSLAPCMASAKRSRSVVQTCPHTPAPLGRRRGLPPTQFHTCTEQQVQSLVQYMQGKKDGTVNACVEPGCLQLSSSSGALGASLQHSTVVNTNLMHVPWHCPHPPAGSPSQVDLPPLGAPVLLLHFGCRAQLTAGQHAVLHCAGCLMRPVSGFPWLLSNSGH